MHAALSWPTPWIVRATAIMVEFVFLLVQLQHRVVLLLIAVCPVARIRDNTRERNVVDNIQNKRLGDSNSTRRNFLSVMAGGAAALTTGSLAGPVLAKTVKPQSSESLVALLYQSLTPQQKKSICFDWDHVDKKHGLLRTRVSNNWRITGHALTSKFYTKEQQHLIRKIWEGVVNPDWIERFDKQFKDDMGGFGRKQGVAIFGQPGTSENEKFEFVLTGRHGTVRCDGNSTEHVAFGGPILYGHAASGYFEKDTHPNNIFWHQATEANKLYQMFDGKQRKASLVAFTPDESQIAFRGKEGQFDGIAVTEMSPDQKEHLQKVLKLLVEPYRQSDQDEVIAALKKQGGLDACHLAFYEDYDMGEDKIWDNWRLEGPSFIWHYRGAPHVHVWINVADDASVKLNSKNLSGKLRK